MDEPATSGPERILVIGRSPGVILDAAGILRSKGYRADATNQFDEVLTEYDTANIDVVVFGGMVPPAAKQHLTEQISKVNGHVAFVQGLAGIAGLIAAQAEGVTSAAGDGNGVAYDTDEQNGAAHPARTGPGGHRGLVGHLIHAARAGEHLAARDRLPLRSRGVRYPAPRRGSARGVVRHRVRRASRPRVHGRRDARGSKAHGPSRRPGPALRAPSRPGGGDPQRWLTSRAPQPHRPCARRDWSISWYAACCAPRA